MNTLLPARHPAALPPVTRRTAATQPWRGCGLGLTLLAAAGAAQAGSTVYSGNLGNAANPALVASDLGSAQFSDARAIANNVALYTFTLSTAGPVTITSTGFAAGGVDPYFTLFKGAGNGATVLDSNYTQAFSTGGDFSYSATLAIGSYRIALGSFANMSYAENAGVGTLGDGFIGLGEAGSLGDGSYSLQVSTPVPEPGSAACLAFGLALTACALRRSTSSRSA